MSINKLFVIAKISNRLIIPNISKIINKFFCAFLARVAMAAIHSSAEAEGEKCQSLPSARPSDSCLCTPVKQKYTEHLKKGHCFEIHISSI